MRSEIVSKIIDSLNEKIVDKEFIIDKNEFHKINKEESDKKIVFIDGGQAELLKAVNFSLQLIRTAAVFFKNNKKIDNKMNEFFILISAKNDDEKIVYETEIFPVRGKAIDKISFYSNDPTIGEGVERAEISKIGDIARRFSEIKSAEEIIDDLEEGDIIVLDGSLKTLVTNEKEKMERLYNRALNKGVIINSLFPTRWSAIF